jgi:hypothetical protein
MENNKYTLEPYNGINSRYQCPSCHKKGEFSQYVNVNTGEHLHPFVGMCNRVIKCGYHYPPKQYFEANKSLGITHTQISHFKPQIKPILKPHYISADTVASTLEAPRNANFIKFLETKYGEAETKKVISKYQLGAVKNDVVFWQIDTSNRVRTGKIMKYDPTSGKRLKGAPPTNIIWAHKHFYKEGFIYVQCLFGENLIYGNNHTIAVVESEKTAIISSLYFPDKIWVATGGIGNFKLIEALNGRNVILYPDTGCYEIWRDKAYLYRNKMNISISTILEHNALELERENGYDLADFLLQFDLDEFKIKMGVIKFDKWITDNPEGGVFENDGQMLKITKK